MPLITKWDGSTLIPASPENERTALLGTFNSVKRITTYFPLPAAYAELVTVSYLYKVPIHFSGRPDLIAAEVYQSADLWWVVLWANSIVDPFARPHNGEVIKIIDIQSMKDLLK